MININKLKLHEGLMVLLVTAVLILLLFGLKEFYGSQKKDSPSKMTEYILRIMAKTIESSSIHPPKDASGKELRKWVVDNNLNFFLPNKKWCPATYYAKVDNSYDFFGNPINIEYISNIPTTINSHKFKVLKYNLVIWSSGKNGINEWGQGDDIALKKLDNIEDNYGFNKLRKTNI